MPIRALVTWFTLLVVAIANGWFREILLIPRFGFQMGHIVSTIILAAGILIVTFLAVPWIRPDNDRSAIVIGLTWVVLTLLFEFGFGRLRGKSWTELLADYNLLRGRIWVLVLVVTAVAPWLTGRARGLLTQNVP